VLFPTLSFLLFFLGVAAGMLLLRPWHEWQKRFLVVASYFFYAQWNWRFCLLLALVSALTWVGGLLVARAREERTRGRIVGAVVSLLLLQLGVFKYFDFLVGNANGALDAAGAAWRIPFMEIILPVGISFFTFHGISYLVDVKRGQVGVCRRLTDMLLYLSFFPQLVAGPIVRAAEFLPQLYAGPRPPLALAPAFALILGGLFKKVIVANDLATQLVDPVFFDPAAFGAADLLLAAYGYAVQIYCDFSAYTDMAIGLAALLGYRFPPNFDQPYRAQRLQEFWRRWHISLSSWLRDYLYKPLGGSRGGRWFTARNLLLTMLLGGIWHGAAWKFVLWGAIHGVGLVVERGLSPWLDRLTRGWLGRVVATLVVFHLVCLAWIFFRADSLETVGIYLGGLGRWGQGVEQASGLTVGLIGLGMALQFVPRDASRRLAEWAEGWPRWALAVVVGAVVMLIDALGPSGVAPFIYFQF
jgi:D-alanyl-lipoteichoic acid acyltransferase DltB (MBOAT superfamily)